MKILVTGGAGFIGTSFIGMMLTAHPEYEVICLDSLTYAGNMENLAPYFDSPRFSFIKADIRNSDAVYKAFTRSRPDIVVNFATESHVDRSIEEPKLFVETNVDGTANLLNAARHFDIRRFHQVSTDEVYGDLPLDDTELSFTEESPLKPSSPYSASKAAADLLVLAYARTYGLPVTVSRSSNNYGPYQFPEKLIPLISVNSLTDGDIPIYGNGLNVRDWLWVKDNCKAIDTIIHSGVIGEIYNVSSGNERNNIDIAREVLSLSGNDEKRIKYVSDRPGHDLRYSMDSSKLKALGWYPGANFNNALTETVRWYSDNRGWWERILSGEYRENNIKYCEILKERGQYAEY